MDFIIWIIAIAAIILVLYVVSARFRGSKLGRNVGKHVDKDGDNKPFV